MTQRCLIQVETWLLTDGAKIIDEVHEGHGVRRGLMC